MAEDSKEARIEEGGEKHTDPVSLPPSLSKSAPRKKPKQTKERHPAKEEVSIDLSAITKFFKGSGKKEIHKEEKKEEEISIDFKGMKNFFKGDVTSLLKRYYPILLIAIPFILAIFLRMQSMDLAATDQWAVNSVVGYYKGLIKSQIDQQYPNLPDANKNTLIEKQFADYAKQNKAQIDTQIAQASAFFKSYFQYEENGKQYEYMPDIDPYFWLRYARNYVETGHQYDEIKDGVEWDNHMLAPFGTPAQTRAHNLVLAWTYKFISIFSPKIPLMQAAGYFPVILMALAVIPSFFIGRRIGGNVGGFFTAALVAVHPAIIGRTLWGHADTDAYNILLPLTIVWLFLESFDAKRFRNRLICAGLAGLSLAIYGLFWEWWYIFYFVMGAAGAYLLYTIATNAKELKKGLSNFIKVEPVKISFLTILAFFIASIVFIILILGYSNLTNSIVGPFQFIKLKVASTPDLWPNVYTTVAELNPASLNDVIGSLGGRSLFYLSLLGILLAFTKKDPFGKSDIKYPFLMAFWYIGTIYASGKGIRFTLLLAPMFSIALGALFGIGYKYITGWFARSFEVNKKITGVILIVIFLGLTGLIMIPGSSGCPFFPGNSLACSAYNTARSDIPLVNDVWYNALIKIRDNSQKNAIITSWWDFGHHFKYIADRPVTFDGASQVGSLAHYVGKLLLTDDEKFSVSILRLLDCGGTNVFNDMTDITKDTALTRQILDTMIVMDKVRARSYLTKEQKFSEADAEKMLKMTHCTPPEGFLITSDDMIGKAGVWGHFGSWDFVKADVWQNARSMPRQQAIDYLLSKKYYGLTKEQAEALYDQARSIFDDREANNWISPWPGYVAGPEPCQISSDNQTLRCQSGIMINFTTGETLVPAQQGIGHPASVIYPKQNGELKEIKYNDSNIPFSLVIAPTKDGFTGLVTSPELAKSMFTRLFFMKGHGLSCFKPFYDEKGLTGTVVTVWKVDWDCKTKNTASSNNVVTSQ